MTHPGRERLSPHEAPLWAFTCGVPGDTAEGELDHLRGSPLSASWRSASVNSTAASLAPDAVQNWNRKGVWVQTRFWDFSASVF